jgi:hypothetical protein
MPEPDGRRLLVNQLVAVGLYLAFTAAALGGPVADAAATGDWGGAIGTVVGRLLLFYLVQLAVWYGCRFILRAPKIASRATSRLNYVSLVLAIATVSTLGNW